VIQILILAGSLVLLALASHFTIKSVEKMIELTGLSEASAGFIILAIFTSTPEIVVALFSILEGTPGMSIGDILGSNIFNMGAVLGILGMLGYLRKCSSELWLELTDIHFFSSLVPLLLVISQLHIFEIPSQIIGVILLGVFLVNIYVMNKNRTPPVRVDESKPAKKEGWARTLMIFFLGISCVFVAARFTVSSGISIAGFIGIAPILIGAKIVSIGTSLPELTLDLFAAKRGRIHLALGDIIGSNLTNLTLVLGLVLLFSPGAFDITIFTELLPFLFITTIVLWRYLTKGGISQAGGIILIMIYILFQAVTR
jgi:cation:H+ antiporter